MHKTYQIHLLLPTGVNLSTYKVRRVSTFATGAFNFLTLSAITSSLFTVIPQHIRYSTALVTQHFLNSHTVASGEIPTMPWSHTNP